MTTAPTRKKFPLLPVIVGLAAVALIATVVLTFDSGGGSEFGSPTITGDSLAFLPDGAADPALGQPSPEVTGADFDGNPVAISHNGKAKIVLFLAHWCPHCQAEVPVVQSWLDTTTLPDNVELISVATSTSSTRENYPPSAWLERENWTAPVIVDDQASSVGNAFGLTAFPYWVFLDTEGNVLARLSGEIPASDLDLAVATLAAQPTG